jgi:hypothetical protein
MQISLKRKGDYAVRAMISVGRHHGIGLRQARQISTEMHIPYKTLTLIKAGLVAEGLLVATHGSNGAHDRTYLGGLTVPGHVLVNGRPETRSRYRAQRRPEASSCARKRWKVSASR